jgi:hypothetical protein
MNLRKFFSRETVAKDAPAVWQTDAQLRLFAFHPDVHKRELMAADFREFLRGMDEYNEQAAPGAKVSIEIRKELADYLQTFIEGTSRRSPLGGVSHAQGFRVTVGRAVYEADYYNDQVFNTGLRVYRAGEQKKAGEFLFGLGQPADFATFAESLVPKALPKRWAGLFRG